MRSIGKTIRPVFQNLENRSFDSDGVMGQRARICEANFGNIHRWDGDALHLVPTHNTPPGFAEFRRRSPIRLLATPPADCLRGLLVGRSLVEFALRYCQVLIELAKPRQI
jgi:hypothetical protein